MILHVYGIKDRATNSFSAPMFMVSPGQAMRVFGDEFNRRADDNIYNKHPEDYDVYDLGIFSTDSGRFSPVDDVVLFVRASDLIIKE